MKGDPLIVRSLIAGLLIAAGMAPALLAQEEHPNRATGAREETLYSSNGADDINLFNGNLTYRISIGTPVPVGPQLSIAPVLVYNSHNERRWRYCRDTPDHPTGDRAVGTGWSLRFGRLVPIRDRPPTVSTSCEPPEPSVPSSSPAPVKSKISTEWGYEAPDGAVHEFFDRRVEASCDVGDPTCEAIHPPNCFDAASRPTGHCYAYTHDGSFLRLDPIDPEHGGNPTVYFPDGTFRVLGFKGGRHPGANPTPTDLDFADAVAPWHTTIVGDNFGNQYTVQYYGDPADPSVPPHPLPAPGGDTHEHDALPFRVFPSSPSTPHTPLRPWATFQFDYSTVSYVSVPRFPAVLAPRLTTVWAPTSIPNGSGGFRQAAWTFEHDHSLGRPDLTRLVLPTEHGAQPLEYAFTWYGTALTRIDLPTGGSIGYEYETFTLWARSPSFHDLIAFGDYRFAKDSVRGVGARKASRLVRPATGGLATVEEGRTTYVRSYRIEDACSANSREDCRLRVDVWSPRGNTSEPYRVTRTVFGESDGVTNTPLYGRPLQTWDYEVYASAPDRGPIDGATPYRSTTFSYQFDGPTSPTNPTEGVGAGSSHNTRESGRLTTWGGRSLRSARLGWDGNGHWTTTIEYENDGTGEIEIRRVEETRLNRVSSDSASARWILDPVTSRTVSRPANVLLDPADANLSTTETFTYDTTGFRTAQEIVSLDLGRSRTLRRTWEKGTATTGPCLAYGASSIDCANLGLPRRLTETLTGSLDGSVVNSSYERRFYYRYSTLAAARDSVNFYDIDRDIAPNGQVIGERGPEGRTSLADLSPQLTTTTAYDLLGRPVLVQPPAEGPEVITWSPQSVLRVKRDASGNEARRREVFFDQLGRPSSERVLLPNSMVSCRITTYDAAGRTVALSGWWKNGHNGLGNRCDDLVDVQAAPDPVTPGASIPPGTTFSLFDALGRPRQVRLADGSVVEDDFAGWWTQATTRSVNAGQGSAITSTTIVSRDGLGQARAVTEPAAQKADGTAMNPPETTSFRYDHAGRLISAKKPRSAGSVVYDQWQVRTRSYDDFGWLVSRQDPEQQLFRVWARDARGNPLRSNDGTGMVIRTFDAAGRPLNSERVFETTTYDWDGTPVKWYEVFAYDSLPGFDFGRSNGRLVWSIRANHAVTNRGDVDFGWIGVTNFYHYNGLGGRLGFRQQSDLLMPEPALPGPQVASDSSASKESKTVKSFRQFFVNQGRSAKSKDDLFRAIASETAAAATTLGSPYSPEGLARWSYSWDSAGRLQSVTYPRRDEGFATVATYGYEAGLLTVVTASFRDPFVAGPVGTVSAYLGYDANGRVRSTSASTSAQPGVAFEVITEGDASGLPRPSSWLFRRRSGSGVVDHELREYSYDPSGNITGIASSLGYPASYRYDSRSRLVYDSLGGRTYNPETREYDGFGNLVRIVEAGTTDLTTTWSTNRLSSSLATYDSAGNMTDDKARNVGRDYYPDGALTAEFSHAPGSNSTQYPSGISAWLVNGEAENTFSFWGDGLFCQNNHFRSLVRDESAQILTEYNGEKESPCTCDTPCVWRDRFYRDVVRLGPWATASYTRGTGIRLEARDHLGTPRFVTTASGSVVSTILLDSFGRPLAGSPATRETFTGHERNHVSGDGNLLPLSDYMHARTYVPMLGRFTRPDPVLGSALLDPQAFNRYSYARNSPTKYVDPDGETIVVADNASRNLLANTMTRPSGRATITAIARDPSFTVKVRDGLITPQKRIDLERSVTGKAKVTFGLTTPTVKVEAGKVVPSGAHVVLDSTRIRKMHSDSSGVNTTAHEFYHVQQIRDGQMGEVLEAADLPTNETGDAAKAGAAVAAENADITIEAAMRLLEELLRGASGKDGGR
jgi:RHS repeat-associated protein